MNTYKGHVREILLDRAGNRIAWLRCPDKAVPAPGRYVMTWRPNDFSTPLAVPLFAAAYDQDGFLAVASVPLHWEPGDILQLRGAIGRGFNIPTGIRTLALATFSGQAERLMPLVFDGLAHDNEIALFMDGELPELPPAVEIHPLSVLRDALSWADFVALEVPLAKVPQVVSILSALDQIPYTNTPGQVLVLADMPCGGLADCSVCSLKVGWKWKLVCKDGPVFELGEFIVLNG
jgi:hypothetical protein